MNTLLLSLLGLAVLCAFYGIIKIALVARDFNYRRSVFDHRIEGRKAIRSTQDRRRRFSAETYPRM